MESAPPSQTRRHEHTCLPFGPTPRRGRTPRPSTAPSRARARPGNVVRARRVLEPARPDADGRHVPAARDARSDSALGRRRRGDRCRTRRSTRAAIGDRVTGTYFQRWIAGPQRLAHVREQYGANHDGWLAEYVVLEEDSVLKPPDHLTDAEAASLTCAGVVAWAAVTKPAPVTPGETVLTIGTGTVALFAVQFARMHGARVISVTSSADKAKRLRELGAHEVIDRTETPDWEQAVRDLTGGDGVEHVIDAVGMPTLPKSVASAAFNARITLIGAFPAAAPVQDPFGGNYVSIRRIAVGSRTDFEAMNQVLSRTPDAAGDRSRVPVRRSARRLPILPRRQPVRQGRHHCQHALGRRVARTTTSRSGASVRTCSSAVTTSQSLGSICSVMASGTWPTPRQEAGASARSILLRAGAPRSATCRQEPPIPRCGHRTPTGASPDARNES